jgi:hypothetical protein
MLIELWEKLRGYDKWVEAEAWIKPATEQFFFPDLLRSKVNSNLRGALVLLAVLALFIVPMTLFFFVFGPKRQPVSGLIPVP